MLLSGLLEHHASCLANRCIRATKTRPRGYVVNAAVHPLLVVLLRKCSQSLFAFLKAVIVAFTHVASVLHGFEQRLAVGVIVADPRPSISHLMRCKMS